MPELKVSVIRSSFPVMRRGVAEKPFEEGREEVLGVGAHEVPPEGLQGGRSEGRRKTNREKSHLLWGLNFQIEATLLERALRLM